MRFGCSPIVQSSGPLFLIEKPLNPAPFEEGGTPGRDHQYPNKDIKGLLRRGPAEHAHESRAHKGALFAIVLVAPFSGQQIRLEIAHDTGIFVEAPVDHHERHIDQISQQPGLACCQPPDQRKTDEHPMKNFQKKYKGFERKSGRGLFSRRIRRQLLNSRYLPLANSSGSPSPEAIRLTRPRKMT